jgi:hypothetical protein
VQLFAGSVFSAATCIFSGVLLSVGMLLYKKGRMAGWALILPSLTFVYEMLPIELPTDLDNIFALGGSCFTMWWGRITTVALEKGANHLLGKSDENDVIDVTDKMESKPVARRRPRKRKAKELPTMPKEDAT